jgi:hypothetical protein
MDVWATLKPTRRQAFASIRQWSRSVGRYGRPPLPIPRVERLWRGAGTRARMVAAPGGTEPSLPQPCEQLDKANTALDDLARRSVKRTEGSGAKRQALGLDRTGNLTARREGGPARACFGSAWAQTILALLRMATRESPKP